MYVSEEPGRAHGRMEHSLLVEHVLLDDAEVAKAVPLGAGLRVLQDIQRVISGLVFDGRML